MSTVAIVGQASTHSSDVRKASRWHNRAARGLVALVIAASGNPATALAKEAVYIGLLGVCFVYWLLRPVKLNRGDRAIIGVFALIVVAHVATFGSLVWAASAGFLVKLLAAALTARLVKDFDRHYIAVMSFMAAMSLVFYLPHAAGIDMIGRLHMLSLPAEGTSVHIGIHNYHDPAIEMRNCGMFWEPGAFAGYLVLALMFLAFAPTSSVSRLRTAILLIVALLSTQSTTGYVALFLILLAALFRFRLNRSAFLRLAILPAAAAFVVAIGYIAFKTVPFLDKKISHQLDYSLSRDTGYEMQRFGNMMYDFEAVASRPLLGWSANPETRTIYDRHIKDLVKGQGNGLTGFATKFGVFGLALVLYLFWRCAKVLGGNQLMAVFGVAILSSLLVGEQFLNFPVFLVLLFLGTGAARGWSEPERGYYAVGREPS